MTAHEINEPRVLAWPKEQTLKPYPNLLAYRERCTERPAWKKTLTADIERVEGA